MAIYSLRLSHQQHPNKPNATKIMTDKFRAILGLSVCIDRVNVADLLIIKVALKMNCRFT